MRLQSINKTLLVPCHTKTAMNDISVAIIGESKINIRRKNKVNQLKACK